MKSPAFIGFLPYRKEFFIGVIVSYEMISYETILESSITEPGRFVKSFKENRPSACVAAGRLAQSPPGWDSCIVCARRQERRREGIPPGMSGNVRQGEVSLVREGRA